MGMEKCQQAWITLMQQNISFEDISSYLTHFFDQPENCKALFATERRLGGNSITCY